MTPESQILHLVKPLMDRSTQGGMAILLDKDFGAEIYSVIKTAEGAVRIAGKLLEAIHNQAAQNKDLVTSGILTKTLETFHRELARSQLYLGGEEVKQ